MKKKYVEILGIGIVLFLIIAILGPSKTASYDKSRYTSCASCHGQNGEGGYGTKLSGKSAAYIANRLNQYKNKENVGRQSAIMWSQSSSLTEQEIRELSEYIESL